MKKVLSRKNEGITLIALIITVIVMLILAGVAINLTVGDNGIFKKSDEGAKIYKNAANNEATSLNEIDKEMGDLIDQYHNDENKNYTMVDGVPVPKGFTHIEGTKETGFVIKNDTDGNEFVWIPVEEGCGYTYNRYAFEREGWKGSTELWEFDTRTNSYQIGEKRTETSQSSRLAYLNHNIRIATTEGPIRFVEAMPSDEITSVNQYKGYYIGRYEVGVATEYNRELKIQKGLTVYCARKTEAKVLGENLYKKSENNVTSKLCSSYAWDTALKFIETKHSGWATNSEGGCYSLTEAPLTGYYSVNNIYDMGGNFPEWTTEEAINDFRNGIDVVRGYYNKINNFIYNASDCPAAARYSIDLDSDTYTFRVTLYL